MKQELRLNFNEDKILQEIIKKCYFDSDNLGKINGNKNYFNIKKDSDTYNELDGLDNIVVKFENDRMLEGVIRCLIKNENGELRAYPVSIYCIKLENGFYSFY
tara:strand:- start:602 stop:910 length:309 start_codon:yes stop_codon:yes gene_type:complete